MGEVAGELRQKAERWRWLAPSFNERDRRGIAFSTFALCALRSFAYFGSKMGRRPSALAL
jgi:hypothetical protein